MRAPTAPAAAPLGTYGDRQTPPTEKRQERRSSRHTLKASQRRLTTASSSRFCWYASATQVSVDVGEQLTAHVSGIRRCGSSWACPVCAPGIRERRAVEVDQAVRVHLERGGGAEFLTLTVQHHRRNRLSERMPVVSQSLGLILQGSAWKRRRDRLGYVGSIKAVEVTWGEANGWHPHSHSLLLFDRPLTDEERADLHRWVLGRWSKVCDDRRLGAVHPVHGVDLRSVTDGDGLGRYVTKVEGGWTAGHELARGDRKGSAPIQLLARFVETGEVQFRDLWCEYEEATYGHAALMWSRGLRALLLGVEDQADDEELAAGEGLDLTLFRALIEAGDWRKVLRAGVVGQLLTNIEHGAAVLLLLLRLSGHEPQPLDLPTGDP